MCGPGCIKCWIESGFQLCFSVIGYAREREYDLSGPERNIHWWWTVMPDDRKQKDRIKGRASSRRAQRVIEAERAKRKRLLKIIGGVVGAALVVALVLLYVNRDTTPEAAKEPVNAPPELAASIPRDGMVLGDPDAPVRVIEYGDFQCPACGQFSRNVEPMLIQQYVETGKVAFEWHTMAFIGPESREAGEAALCAMDQDAFWPMHNTLFHNQVGENAGAFDRSRLDEMARIIDLDMDAFGQCMDDNTYEDDVMASNDAGGQAGVRSTPSFSVNGQLIQGGAWDQLQQAIESALAAASS